jgi:hypothetical protein
MVCRVQLLSDIYEAKWMAFTNQRNRSLLMLEQICSPEHTETEDAVQSLVAARLMRSITAATNAHCLYLLIRTHFKYGVLSLFHSFTPVHFVVFSSLLLHLFFKFICPQMIQRQIGMNDDGLSRMIVGIIRAVRPLVE